MGQNPSEIRQQIAQTREDMGETIDANSFEENTNGPAELKTKAEIVQYLKDSFALGHRAISGVTSENEVTPLPKPVSPFLSTRLAIAIIGAFHPKDHYGQMVEYLRMNGIVPPASRPRPQQQQSSQPKNEGRFAAVARMVRGFPVRQSHEQTGS